MGGSQLKALKSNLRSSGLSRTSNPKDERKRAKQRKDLSSSSLAHRNSKLDAIHDKFNLFDIRDEKKKFEVVTRRGEVEGGKKGMPGRSRAAGIETRKKTLLPMLDARTHSSTFLDHRFGESSTNLTPEEKALERFTAERQSRLGKKTKFNLEDEDEGGFELTHGGRTLGFGDEEELESGGWGGLGVSEGANREPLLKRRKMGAEPVEEEDEPERKKTHAEIMEEVVAKSKYHKAERKRMKSADDETRIGLDADLKDLRTILGGSARMPASNPRPADSSAAAIDEEESEDDEDEDDAEMESLDGQEEDSEGEDSDGEEGDSGSEGSDGSTYELNDEELEAALAASSAKSGVDRDLLRKLIGSAADRSPSPQPVASTSANPAFEEEEHERPAPRKPAEEDEADKDPYDNYVRLLALEPRAHATNRMKTPLELAQQAAEELKEREEKRLKRQRGERDDSSDEEGEGKKDKKGKGKRVPQADDLDDDFLEEDVGSEGETEEGLGKGLETLRAEAESDEEGSGEQEEEEEGGDSGDGGEEESEDEMDVGDLSAEDSDEEAVTGETESLVAPTKFAAARAGAELPFTFPCPSTHGEFVRLLTSSNIKEEDTPLVVKRIRTLYHPGLSVGNKEKLQVFTNVLLDHVIYLAASSSPTAFRTINSLLPPLLTLSHAYPLTSAPHYVSKLRLMHKNFLRGLSRGPLDPAAKTWPGLAELTLLRMVGMVWSTSDLSHPVTAAAQLLIGEYLAQARVRNLADLASGLFLCTLASQYERDSKRLFPESTNFILYALLLLLPTTITSKSFLGNFPTPDFQQDQAKSLKLRSSAKGDKANVELSERVNLIEAVKEGKNVTGDEAEQLKANLVKTALALLSDSREKYSASEAFVELFQPAETVLKAVKLQKVPSSIKDEISSTVSTLSKSLTFALQSRKPLTLQHHRAIPIATYLPKFDESFNPNSRFDPDTERAAASKLKALYKKEKKGAVRELRKDNKFLAVEEAKRKQTDDVAYEKKITKIMGSLQDERAEEKAFDREKTRGKRRDKARRG